MANRKETTEKSLREQMRALFLRNSARSNGQALQTQQPNPSQPAPPGARTQVNESRRGIWQRLYRRERRIQDIKSVGATTSATTSATTPATTSAANVESSNQQECVICGDDFPLSSLESLSCGHYFCDNCLILSFRLSLDNDSLFPPSCCHQDIPLSPRVTRTLPADLFKLFLEKKNDVNAEEPQQKRTYCHVPRCSAWIRPENIIDNIAPCPECEAFTCANCKEEYHDNGMCTKKGGLQVPEVDDLGEKEGWKRCPSCGQMIQRTAGCSVIDCITCGCTFCYDCGELQPDCNCGPRRMHRHMFRHQPPAGQSCGRCGSNHTTVFFNCSACGITVCTLCFREILQGQ